MEKSLSPAQRILQIVSAYWTSRCVQVASKLGLPDQVAGGPRSVDDLARATQTHAPALNRLLGVLVAVGLFTRDEQGLFGPTDLSRCLESNGPLSQHALAMVRGGEQYQAWGELEHSIRTGKPAFDHLYGVPWFEWLGQHPEQAALFDQAMVGVHGAESAAIVEAYDFSWRECWMDIGGGNGSLLHHILEHTPSVRGILFDLPHVVARAQPTLHPRCQAVGGSFFEAIPPVADGYLMRHILHDWDEASCVRILTTVRKAMAPECRLLVVEGLLPEGNNPSFTRLLDLNMLVMLGGQERTITEYRNLLTRTGFQLERIIGTRTEVSILEAKPA
ncbi:MAG: methyltransferase [Gemmataceae bacterium]